MEMSTAEEIRNLQYIATKDKIKEQLQIIKDKIDEHLANGNCEISLRLSSF